MSTLLLVHAFPVDASMWSAQAHALSDEHTVLAPSLPGFGGTPSAGEVMTMDAAADFLIEELDRSEVDRAVVCGLSMGGYVAFSMWRRNRDRLAGLVLANTRAEPDDEAGKERRKAVAEKARSRGSGAIADEPPPLLSEGAGDDLWRRVKGWIRAQPGESVAAASLGIGEREDSRPILSEIDVPTAVITSTGDTLIPPDVSSAMADAIPQADLVILDAAGHLSNLEDPQGFNTALRSVLSRAE